jgi:hypothetical protein
MGSLLMTTHSAIWWSIGLGTALILTVSSSLDGAEPQGQTPATGKADLSKRLTDEDLQKLLKRYGDDARISVRGDKKFTQEPGFREMVEELRRRHPYESLSQRLAYEAERVRQDPKIVSAPKLTDTAAKQLDEQERQQVWRQRWEKRAESLRMLHTDEVERFVSREGFGLERAPQPSMHHFQLPKGEPIPLATLTPLSAEQVGDAVTLAAATIKEGTARMPSVEQVTTLHRAGMMDFVNPSFFGHVKDREKVSGFQSHQFRNMVRLDLIDKKNPDAGKERWQLKRLELVSLLKHEQPAVYVSEHLPRMDQLAKAKVRTLNSFEEKALKALQDGEDLKTEATTNVIRMVGDMRATKQCLECHAGERGQLLGAFSYELQRDPPLPVAR